MKSPKPEPVHTQLDPSHPNYDAILLKRSRLEAHRRRRLENSGELAPRDWGKGKPAAKTVKKPRAGSKGRSTSKA
ncbi:hypothetical protein [Hyphomicrobium sp. CS1GBMeth3]|uniref:hypothetical protein n=1 Tax=Hyphomicrobium sp. CS1GBMeth3 TaxID=1892845 RepID=UPI000A7E8EA6|nr:hypothetical protein [Hyphomicrobium sp. CS1GBMeth3]